MKLTPMQKVAARTRRVNELRRAAQLKGIRSPYKQGVYIKKEMKGTQKWKTYPQLMNS